MCSCNIYFTIKPLHIMKCSKCTQQVYTTKITGHCHEFCVITRSILGIQFCYSNRIIVAYNEWQRSVILVVTHLPTTIKLLMIQYYDYQLCEALNKDNKTTQFFFGMFHITV